MTTMDERGTAEGFSDTKEKVGVGPVGVGNKLPVTEAPETVEPAGTEAPEEAAVEAATEGLVAAEEAAPLDDPTS